MLGDIESLTLFSFILRCYEEIALCNFEDVVPLNKDIDLDFIIKEVPSINFKYFIACLEKKKILALLNNKRIISQVLQWIDSNIYQFEDYKELIEANQDFIDSNLEGEEFYLVIQSSNSIHNQMNKFSKTSDYMFLRKRKHFNPLKLSVKLGLRNFTFLKKQRDFKLKQKFVYMENLASNLQNGEISVAFYPTICKSQYGDIFMVRDHMENQTITIEYSYKTDRFSRSFKNAVENDADIKVFPEIVLANKNLDSVKLALGLNKRDTSSLIIAGTTWHNGQNTVHIFNEIGQEIVKQQKHIPYVKHLEQDNMECDLFERINNHSFEINLLHIVNFGLIGFPICSDLNSNKYIESIFCESGVDMLITSCLSESDDVFSSLDDLSKRYCITIIACNTCINRTKYPALIFLPTKIKSTRACKIMRKKCKYVDRCKYCCGIEQKISLKKLTK